MVVPTSWEITDAIMILYSCEIMAMHPTRRAKWLYANSKKDENGTMDGDPHIPP